MSVSSRSVPSELVGEDQGEPLVPTVGSWWTG